jgi:molecular chaperone DnaK
LLVDVTPLSLGVETVGGYCDMVIPRNTPVPCEQSRAFATASDNQIAVHVRVCQGESSRFIENTMLGELELTGLERAQRGQVQVLVTFSLDTDGILGVRARNAATGNETSARIRLIGVSETADVDRLAARHAAHPVF